MAEQDFDLFITKIYKATGIDLGKYKRPQMVRRLTTLYSKHGYANFAEYYQAIMKDQKLFAEFLDRITINVSEFFRNPGRWQVVRERVIPELLRRRRKLKIWSAACSTGEEPYTIVLILQQFVPLREIQVLATDIDENALNKAKIGIYHERSLQSMPSDLRHSFFRPVGEQKYAIAEEVKRCVTFRRQNLLEDPFEQNFDLIVCRNVIIYFTDDAKERLYYKFARALSPGGILFVGSTEQIFNPRQYGLRVYDTFFYQREE